MADKTLASLTAATPATGGLLYGTQGGADRKFTLTAAGAALVEAADPAAAGGWWQALPMSAITIQAGDPVMRPLAVVPIHFVPRKLVCVLPWNYEAPGDAVSFEAEFQMKSELSHEWEAVGAPVELTIPQFGYVASAEFSGAPLEPGKSYLFAFSATPYMAGSMTLNPWLIGTWSHDL